MSFYGRIQKFPLGGGRESGRRSLVINVFQRGSYGPPSRGSTPSRGGSIPVLPRRLITTCYAFGSLYTLILGLSVNNIIIIDNFWASTRENLSSGVCEQQRHGPACAYAQSDQRICCSLNGKYNV